MKKLCIFLVIIAGLYGSIGNTLVEAGTKSIQSTAVKMAQAGV